MSEQSLEEIEDLIEELRQRLYCPERALAFEPFRREIEALEARAARHGIELRPQAIVRPISLEPENEVRA